MPRTDPNISFETEGNKLPEVAGTQVGWPPFRKPMFVVISRRHLYFVAFLLVLACVYGLTFGRTETALSVLRDEEPRWKVAIDAGHGGPDPGAVGVAGTLEKDIALAVALHLEHVLHEFGAATVMTRRDDADLVGDRDVPHRQRADLIARAELVNASQADVFVSLHANSFPNPSLRGAQAFYAEGDDGGWRLALHIQSALGRALAPNSRRAAAADLRILHDVHAPAVVVEVGFLTNPTEEQLLNDDEYQKRVARAVADGIVAYLNEQRRVPSVPTRPGR